MYKTYHVREGLNSKTQMLLTLSPRQPRAPPKGSTGAPKTPKGSQRGKESITKLPINRPSGRYVITRHIATVQDFHKSIYRPHLDYIAAPQEVYHQSILLSKTV